MADKNLHDIKIDDLDKSKKNPLKNILTLLALLFVILVISVVITRLILNPDEDSTTLEANNSSSSLIETERVAGESESSTDATAGHLAAAAVGMGAAAAIVSNPKERNVSTTTSSSSSSNSNDTTSKDSDTKVKNSGSKIKGALRERQPVRVRELPTPKHVSVIPKKHVVKKTPKKTTTVHRTTKKHVDKVVVAKRNRSSKSVEGKVRTGIYIKVGSFKDVSNAIKKIKKTGLNYALVKTKNDKSITRVLVGPFKSNWGAQQHLPSVRNNIAEGAYITRIK